jgi:gas vesicle protein
MRDYVQGISAGFVVGIAIGIAVGFLFAPMPGKEVRNVFKETAEDVSGRVKEVVGDRKKMYTQAWREQQEQEPKKLYHRYEAS